MTYNINRNENYNSLEISFDHKPSEKIRETLKALKFRWHNQKQVWYGRTEEHRLISAIQAAETEENPLATGVIYSDGYMGAVKTDGINSNKYLHGSNLSEAIRNHLKQLGIKGVTVSCKTYSGGQTLTLKVKFTPDTDIIPFEKYLETYRVHAGSWYYYNEDGKTACSMFGDRYFDFPAETQEELRRKFAEYAYNKIREGQTINNYYMTAEHYPEFAPDFFKKLCDINKVVASYRYDDSNSMVDYFDTNFYYDICTVPTK